MKQAVYKQRCKVPANKMLLHTLRKELDYVMSNYKISTEPGENFLNDSKRVTEINTSSQNF